MIGRRNKPVGIAFVFPDRVAVEAVRAGVDSPDALRAAGTALAGLQRAVEALDRRAVLALVGGDLAELERLAGLPAVVAEFQRRVGDELARDGAVRLKFDSAARDLIEQATSAERVLAVETARDRAKLDDRLVKLRLAGVDEGDIGRLTDAATPDRAADQARVDALKAEAEQARVYLGHPLRPAALLPQSIAPKV
ncbi:hypothetical protein HZU83_01185 [Sphaerotilus montanus]|uniref:Uncharacterized protein n=1 Tax=Sphaerotilus montanus TaxID=522889 RepID=A0A7Y9UI33_9BURK|nr:hypothetical protein [Sphaerotilus montanus]NYG31305.1 hypothetical protein [Sphaerotilus montanus]NZD55289.1 hypothetical protein [Sphaerotilus montanus]